MLATERLVEQPLRVIRAALTASQLLPVYPDQQTSLDPSGWSFRANRRHRSRSFEEGFVGQTATKQFVHLAKPFSPAAKRG
jgi:hypothetical protein